MHTLTEFDNIPVSQLIPLLQKHLDYKLPKNIPERNLRDLARSILHGKEFLYSNEVKKGDTITQKPIQHKTVFTLCPKCKQKSLSIQPFANNDPMYNSKSCKSCGYWILPDDNSNDSNDTPETKKGVNK